MTETVLKYLNDKAWARWTALVLLSTAMLCGCLFVHVLSPLQTTLQTTLGWLPSVYGNVAASISFLNVFAFFLIISGIILDKAGPRFTSCLAGSLMVIGSLSTWWAMSEWFAGSRVEEMFDGWLNLPAAWWNITPFVSGMLASAKVACVGYMIFGVGIEMAGITVSRSIVRWFQGKEMALAMAVEIAFVRVATVIVFAAAPAIANYGGVISISRPLALCVVLVSIGLICFISFAMMDRRLKNERGEEETNGSGFRLSDIFGLLHIPVFWCVVLLYTLFYAAIYPFQNYAVNMLQCNLGLSEEDAGFVFLVFPVVAAIITPILGNWLDKKQKAVSMLLLGTSLVVICHTLLAFVLPATGSISVAVVAILMMAVAVAMVPSSIYPSVPKLVDAKVLGTAYALIIWIDNLGLYGFRKGLGALLQSVNPGVENPVNYNYTIPMAVLLIVALLSVACAIWLRSLDRQHHYGLERSKGE